MTIIGITGRAGTGKSTVSHELVRRYGFTRLAFADPLKGMLQVFLATYGYPAAIINRLIDGDLKEQPCDALMGSTCRYALQTLGTEWGRDRVHAKLWLHHLGSRIDTLTAEQAQRVVIDDVRMNNEAEYLIDIGPDVEIWEVKPQGDARRHPPAHPSERGLNPELITGTVEHNFTMGSLSVNLDEHMAHMGLDKRGVWAA